MDHLQAHKSKEVKEYIDQRNWKIIYNALYSSKFHCIEEAFASIKRNCKKEIIRLNFELTNIEHRALDY